MAKLCFIDCETTGVDPVKNALIQIAGIVVIDGAEIETFDCRCRPFADDTIVPSALEVVGMSFDEVMSAGAPVESYKFITKILSRHVDKFEKRDKFFFLGWNGIFDSNFVREWFKKNGDNYYGSFFSWPTIDVAVLAAHALMHVRPEFEDFRLETVARYLGIDVDRFDLHDALSDIRITREIYYKIKEGVR